MDPEKHQKLGPSKKEMVALDSGLKACPAQQRLRTEEIIVNAADNLIRDPSMDSIRVDIDRAKKSISVRFSGGVTEEEG